MKSDRKTAPLNIWHVSREMSPLAEAGGIKDVVSGLSAALVEEGHNVTVVLPMYRFLKRYSSLEPLVSFTLKRSGIEEDVSVFSVYIKGIRVLLINASCFSGKDKVYTYSHREETEEKRFSYGQGHLDSHVMNLALQYSALETALHLGESPDLYHLHDGHCGFLPAIMRKVEDFKKYFSRTGALLTIHNGGVVYQQNIESLDEALKLTGLPKSLLQKTKTEQGYNPLVCAGLYGTVNTVSDGYARDILDGTDVNSGELGKKLKKYHIPLSGIINGIEKRSHDRCSHSPILRDGSPEQFNEKKRDCRRKLISRISRMKDSGYVYGNLKDVGNPLVTLQSRITYQKGIDVLLDFIKRYARSIDADFLVLGEGERAMEDELARLATEIENFTYVRFYDPSLSADVFAGGDFFLIPSRWEPCGLTDFIAQLNGNIPIVHETGGLVKTIDGVNGFSYSPNTADELAEKINEAIVSYREKTAFLHEIRKNAVNIINEKYTWRKVLDEGYLPLYRSISEKAQKRKY